MVYSDDVLLIQPLIQGNFVHTAKGSCYPADFITEIVRSADVCQVLRVFVEKITLGKGSVEGFFEIFPVFFSGAAVKGCSVL